MEETSGCSREAVTGEKHRLPVIFVTRKFNRAAVGAITLAFSFFVADRGTASFFLGHRGKSDDHGGSN